MMVGAVRDLYVARWGEPSRKAAFRVAGLEVEVYKWNAEVNPEGVTLYATIGSSAHAVAGRDTKHRVEYFLGLLPPKTPWLARLRRWPCTQTRGGGPGPTRVPTDGPLWPGTDMRCFLVLRPLSNVIPPLELADGMHVEFMQAIPIFESELAYKARHGAKDLLEHWQQTGVAFWDPGRIPEPAYT